MHGEYKMPGGKLIVADLGVNDGLLSDVSISGDFFLEPDTALETINQALENQPADSEETALTEALDKALGHHVRMFGVSPEAIAVAVVRALEDKA
jgi:hypothetical protein